MLQMSMAIMSGPEVAGTILSATQAWDSSTAAARVQGQLGVTGGGAHHGHPVRAALSLAVQGGGDIPSLPKA